MAKFNAQVKAFLKAHTGHTQKALAITLIGVDHMLEHRDWDGLARLMTGTEGRMGKRIKAIVQEVVGGLTIKADAGHPSGLRFTLGDNIAATERLQGLRDLVDAKETIYSVAVDEFLGKEKAVPAPKSEEEVRDLIENLAAKHGFTIEKLTLGECVVEAAIAA